MNKKTILLWLVFSILLTFMTMNVQFADASGRFSINGKSIIGENEFGEDNVYVASYTASPNSEIGRASCRERV